MIEYGNVRIATGQIIAVAYEDYSVLDKFGIFEADPEQDRGDVRLYLASGTVIKIGSKSPKEDADHWVKLSELDKH